MKMKKLLSLTLLALAVSSCQMTVSFRARVDASGAGTFTLGMSFDKEALDQVRASTDGYAALEGLFGALRAKGWSIARAEHNGLDVSASRAFKNPDDFARGLDELRGAPTGATGASFGGMKLNLGIERAATFFRTNTAFRGSIDTSGGASVPKRMRDLLALASGLLRFEVRADLPGGVSYTAGNGTLERGEIVWRPELGKAATFEARASQVRLSSLLVVLLPALALLLGLAWFFIGRRRPRDAASASGRADGDGDQEPRAHAEEFLAFTPDAEPRDEVNEPG
jgi:hypothetical protein